MKISAPLVAVAVISLSASLLACQPVSESRVKANASALAQWPTVVPGVKKDPIIEARVEAILQTLSLEQKVAQMIQADLAHVSAEEISEYRIGSVLNGGGQPPNQNANASPGEWAAYAEMLHQAAMKPEAGKTAIPLLWGTDAVHGHGNLKGATLFPHNIALGATRNTQLVEDIAQATALEVAATGVDWNFAPTVAVARDDRWGRAYESFSEDPNIVATLGAATVRGLQGAANSRDFLSESRVLATAKHFIGDGGTALGDDQGYTQGDEAELIKTHLPGYIAAIEAGAQTVMASYSWWQGEHSHGSRYLLTDVLKGHLKFDGIVVSDWQGIAHIPGCQIDNCPQAVNAGIDIFMMPYAPDWKHFYHNTLAQVRNGDIERSRIDDAVRRILRVKMRAGLWQKPSPQKRKIVAKTGVVGSEKHRALARQAVRESLVLLKNTGVLPLNPSGHIAIVGNAAKNIATQTGGWSVTWQAKGVANDMFPNATSIYQGLENAISSAGGQVTFSENAQQVTKADAAIVVFGEQPYAEMYGDIQNLDTLEFQQHDKVALAQLKKLKARGIPTVAVFLTGRPRWVNKELNAADAFVVAWLPGSEGQGIADVLLSSKHNYNFSGRLSFSWPANPCDAVINPDNISSVNTLYSLGFGLDYSSPKNHWQQLPENTEDWRYGCILADQLPQYQAVEFLKEQGWFFALEKKSLARKAILQAVAFDNISAKPLEHNKGVSVAWNGNGFGRLVLRNNVPNNDFLAQYANGAVLDVNIRVIEKPTKSVNLVVASGHLATNLLDVTKALTKLPLNQWQPLRIDLSCFTRERADMSKIDVPFSLETQGVLNIDIRDVSFRRVESAENVINCL